MRKDRFVAAALIAVTLSVSALGVVIFGVSARATAAPGTVPYEELGGTDAAQSAQNRAPWMIYAARLRASAQPAWSVAASGNRVAQCNMCCSKRQIDCYNQDARARCDTLFANCIATCTSEGQVPSSWGPQCWAASGS